MEKHCYKRSRVRRQVTSYWAAGCVWLGRASPEAGSVVGRVLEMGFEEWGMERRETEG